MKRVITLFAAVFIAAMAMQAASWPGKKGVWNDGKRYDFTVAGRNAMVVVPQKALPGNPWVWRPAFFDAFPSIDIAMLEKGYHIAYFDVTNEWGRPSALKAGKEFHDFMVNKGLSDKVIMEGLSRGGYFSLRYGETYPEDVALLLLDNPLVEMTELKVFEDSADVKKKWAEECIEPYLPADNASRNLRPLVENKIPIVLLSGGVDDVVPFVRNGKTIVDTYKRYGQEVKSIVRPTGGHHPHGLDNLLPSLPEIYLVVEPYVQLTPQTSSWGFDDKGYYEEMAAIVTDLARLNGLPLIVLTDVFRGEQNALYAPNDHPNPEGAARMAKAVADYLK